jgi:hypothetical protein
LISRPRRVDYIWKKYFLNIYKKKEVIHTCNWSLVISIFSNWEIISNTVSALVT